MPISISPVRLSRFLARCTSVALVFSMLFVSYFVVLTKEAHAEVASYGWTRTFGGTSWDQDKA
jgi:ABC-type phosphate transport system permease subunit